MDATSSDTEPGRMVHLARIEVAVQKVGRHEEGRGIRDKNKREMPFIDLLSRSVCGFSYPLA